MEKFYVFRFYKGKNNFAPENAGGVGGGVGGLAPPAPPFSTALYQV